MRMPAFRRYMRANPQVLALLIICIVFGLGAFFAVVFGLLAAGKNATPSGEPSGLIVLAHALL